MFLLKSPLLIISFTVRPARSQETAPALVAFCWFIFAGMCLLILFMARKQLVRYGTKELIKNMIFESDIDASKVFRKYRSHPVFLDFWPYLSNLSACSASDALRLTFFGIFCLFFKKALPHGLINRSIIKKRCMQPVHWQTISLYLLIYCSF